jgi:hypothetical protein
MLKTSCKVNVRTRRRIEISVVQSDDDYDIYVILEQWVWLDKKMETYKFVHSK